MKRDDSLQLEPLIRGGGQERGNRAGTENVPGIAGLGAAAEEVRQAQTQWSRIGQVPEDARRQLSDRFQKAVRRITDRTSRSSAPRNQRGVRL